MFDRRLYHKKTQTMSFFNKLKWVLGVTVVFVLIMATNLIDRYNFVQVRDSVISIYEDRLVANDILFEMLTTIQEKEIASIKSDDIFYSQRNRKIDHDLDRFISRYEQTKLTAEEAREFAVLKRNIASMRKAETAFVESKYKDFAGLNNHFVNIKENLYDLSKIQLDEGGRQMSISKEAINAVELYTQIEIYMLIFLAIVIQVILIYNPKKE